MSKAKFVTLFSLSSVTYYFLLANSHLLAFEMLAFVTKLEKIVSFLSKTVFNLLDEKDCFSLFRCLYLSDKINGIPWSSTETEIHCICIVYFTCIFVVLKI